MYQHIPVLLNEVMYYLDPKPNHQLIDGTVGQGGHACAFLQRALPVGRLLGIDRDASNLAIAREQLAEFGDNVVLVQDSYANVKQHAERHGFASVEAILLDIGFSSAHVDDPERGFSFSQPGPLDMRYDRSQELTAERIVNTWEMDELARIFRIYGEERQAASIAKAIVQRRRQLPFASTDELAALIQDVVPRRGKTHPATKVFQALRIAVNDELIALEQALPDLVDLLKPDGRIAIISFHSLEDRMIKRFFKARDDLEVLTKKPVTASQEEVHKNPRARSAKLRVALKI